MSKNLIIEMIYEVLGSNCDYDDIELTDIQIEQISESLEKYNNIDLDDVEREINCFLIDNGIIED